MKISIIGAGYAGLSSALFLSRHRSNRITIYDRFDQVQTIGAGILIQPSAMEVLRKLDLYKPLIDHSEKVYHLEGINHRGRQVFLTSYCDYKPDSFGIGIHRSILFQSLYHKCKILSNITFKLNQEIVSLTDLKTTNDLIIVANGSPSKLREQVPIKHTYQPYPYGCLWTKIEDDHIALNQLRRICTIFTRNVWYSSIWY